MRWSHQTVVTPFCSLGAGERVNQALIPKIEAVRKCSPVDVERFESEFLSLDPCPRSPRIVSTHFLQHFLFSACPCLRGQSFLGFFSLLVNPHK